MNNTTGGAAIWNQPLAFEGGDPSDFVPGMTLDGMPVTRSQLNQGLGNGSIGGGVFFLGKQVGFIDLSGARRNLTHITWNFDAYDLDGFKLGAFALDWAIPSIGGPQNPVPQPPPAPTPSKGDPNNKCDSRVYGTEMNREMTGIAKKVGGRLDKDKFGNILGTISGLEKVQTQYVLNRFQSAGFVEFYSYNRTVHPGINLERPEPNDTVWYHVTLEPGKTPSMSLPPARITIHCDNDENHTLHHFVQDYLGWPWP